jgi:hypothetical protein
LEYTVYEQILESIFVRFERVKQFVYDVEFFKEVAVDKFIEFRSIEFVVDSFFSFFYLGYLVSGDDVINFFVIDVSLVEEDKDIGFL